MRPPKEGERFFALIQVNSVNGRTPAELEERPTFDYLTPLYPEEHLNMETLAGEYSTRVLDLFSPIGKGQRALIVAQPKTGKTILLQKIANAITTHHPETYLLILLVDERPEEVTDMQRNVKGEVIASTFDRNQNATLKWPISSWKKPSGWSKPVRMSSSCSIRLPGWHARTTPSRQARARRFPVVLKPGHSVGRNGSSVPLETLKKAAPSRSSARPDRHRKPDGRGDLRRVQRHGNSEIVLDRQLADRRIFPAINIIKSGTRREELLIQEARLQRIWILRKLLADMDPVQAMQFLLDKMRGTRNNDEFLVVMNS